MNPARPSSATDTHLARALAGIVQQYGKEIIDDPERLTAALRDCSGGEGRGVFVLLAALAAGVPQRLLGARRNIPPEVFRANLVRNLHSNHGIDMEQALWAVDAWAVAMDLPAVPVALPGAASAATVEGQDRNAAASSPGAIRACPFCGVPGAARKCGSCGRDTAAPRRICAACRKMSPIADLRCWNCGTRFRSDLWWIIPLIIAIFIAAIIISVIVQNS